MKPTVGRTVHFIPDDTLVPLAAFIVAVNEDETINLTVLGSQGGFYGTIIGAKYSEEYQNGFWSWPPKV